MLIITKKVEKYWLITTEEKLVPIVWCRHVLEIFSTSKNKSVHSLFISNRTRIVLKEIIFVLLLDAVDRDEFWKGGTFYIMTMTQMYHKSKTNAVPWAHEMDRPFHGISSSTNTQDWFSRSSFFAKEKKTSARHPSKITISGVSPPCILLLPGMCCRGHGNPVARLAVPGRRPCSRG